jgi:prephenate dehydrogenase
VSVLFERVAIHGVGLIGGSFALALKAAGAVGEVVGIDRDPAVLRHALQLGIIDRALPAGDRLASASDLVFLAVPVAQTGEVLTALAPTLADHTIVTDAGSTKAGVIAAARAALGARIGQFVPGHPLAGREKHGPQAAEAELYHERKVVLAPLPENDPGAVTRVERAWQVCGAHVVRMDAPMHDQALAAVSHLPHLLSYALVAHVAGAHDGALKLSLTGGGFRDFTRIAASSPEMWRDIALANREALLAELDGYLHLLGQLRDDLDRGDAQALEALFARARLARLDWEASQ